MSQREIKFRIWDGKQYHYAPAEPRAIAEFYEKWVITLDGLIFKNRGEGRFLHDIGGIPLRHISELEQFTGLLDKNGKEIYEGDILKIFDHFQLEAVEYEGSSFGFYLHNEFSRESGVFESLADYTTQEGYEIVGNIHENPSLLA